MSWRAAEIEHLAGGGVELLHLQRFVEDDDAVGRVFDDFIREVLGLFLQIGQAHRNLGLAVEHGDGLVAAGVVAAASAVQLVLGLVLAHLVQDFLDRLRAGHRSPHADVAVRLGQRVRVGLIDGEIAVRRVAVDRRRPADGAAVFVHRRTADAASHAGGHLDEALFQPALADLAQRADAVVDAVDGDVGVVGRAALHRAQDAARRREQARLAAGFGVGRGLDRHTFAFHPRGQLLKGQREIDDAGILRRFVLLRDAGADENRRRVGMERLERLAVRLHRGKHRRQTADGLREIFADEQVDRVAAGGDDDVVVAALAHLVVDGLDRRRARPPSPRHRQSPARAAPFPSRRWWRRDNWPRTRARRWRRPGGPTRSARGRRRCRCGSPWRSADRRRSTGRRGCIRPR